MECWQTITNAIIFYGSMPADCLVKVSKRDLDDTEAEILCEKEEPEQREALRIRAQENPTYKLDEICARRISLRMNPVIDQRFDVFQKKCCRSRSGSTSVDFLT